MGDFVMWAQEQWSRCKPLIEAALSTSPNLESIEDVEARVLDGRYQMWMGQESCAVTEIADYDQKRVLRVIHGGGDLSELLDHLEPAMCEFARQSGCDAIMGDGRKGWERVTEKRGYRFAFLTMFKDLKQ